MVTRWPWEEKENFPLLPLENVVELLLSKQKQKQINKQQQQQDINNIHAILLNSLWIFIILLKYKLTRSKTEHNLRIQNYKHYIEKLIFTSTFPLKKKTSVFLLKNLGIPRPTFLSWNKWILKIVMKKKKIIPVCIENSKKQTRELHFCTKNDQIVGSSHVFFTLAIEQVFFFNPRGKWK